MQVVISGYYGFDNLGDEAVLAAMLTALRARLPTATFTVLSATPHKTRQAHHVLSVRRTSLAALRALAYADLFVSGGGSLIQDVTSIRSAAYYLGLLRLATIRAGRSVVYAQGVGPLHRAWIQQWTRRVFDRVDLLTVRDTESRALLRNLGVQKPVTVVADPAFALDPASPERADELLKRLNRPRLGVALRSWGDNAFLVPLLAELRAFCGRTQASVVVLAFHPARDLGVAQRAAEALGGQLLESLQPQEMMAVIGSLDLLVGMRLHALINAVATGVPVVGISYDPKVDALLRRVEARAALSVAPLHAQTVRETLAAAWETREGVRPVLLRHAATLRADALRAADLTAALISPS